MDCLENTKFSCTLDVLDNWYCCADCPAEMAVHWEWRSFGGHLSRFAGKLYEECDLIVALVRMVLMYDFWDLAKATGWRPEYAY